MIAEECLAVANVFKEARNLAWASETPLLAEFSELMADLLSQLSGEFDRQQFLEVANGKARPMGFWTVTWKDPDRNDTVTRELVLRPTKEQALHWLLERRPYLIEYLSQGYVKIEPYKALARKDEFFQGVL